MPEWLLPTLTVVGVFALIFGPTIVAARLEKRMIWPYTSIDEAVPTPQPSARDRMRDDNPYAVGRVVENPGLKPSPTSWRENREADHRGFTRVGTFRHGKGGLYRVLYDFWRSPDGSILALVGGGTIAGLPLQNTWLYSLTDDGRCLITLGDQKGSEIDLGGLAKESLVAGDFARLLDWHQQRLARSAAAVVPFSAADPLGDLLAYRRRRFDRLEERGLSTFLDPERTTWRYTLKGAVTLSFVAILQGMRRAILPDRILERFRRKPARSA